MGKRTDSNKFGWRSKKWPSYSDFAAELNVRPKGDLMVNLGCGNHKLPEPFVNVDSHDGEPVHPDVVDDAVLFLARLPRRSCEVIFMGHLLEHMRFHKGQSLLRAALQVAHNEIHITIPDMREARRMMADGDITLQDLNLVVYGRQDWPGDNHVCYTDARTLHARLVDAMVKTSEWFLIEQIDTPYAVMHPQWQTSVIMKRKSLL